MADRDHRPSHDHDFFIDRSDLGHRPSGGIPGKGTLTSRLPARSQTNIIFRVENAEAARALVGAMGSAERDQNGVRADADEAVARASATSGQPLPADVRSRFEQSVGADLGSVRLHTGPESAAAASAVGARAYAEGQDIHFAEGEYAPYDPMGLRLLAHEVAHTVQQSGGAPRRQNKLAVSTSQDSAEVEADCAAESMVRGDRFAISGTGAGISRQEKDDASESGGSSEISDADKAWATQSRSSLKSMQTEIAVAKAMLLAEAAFVQSAFDQADAAYTEMEAKTKRAASELQKNFKKPLAEGARTRKIIDGLIAQAFVVAAGGIPAIFKGASVAQSMVKHGLGLLISGAKANPSGTPNLPQAGGPSGEDWKSLFRSCNTAFKTFTKLTGTLDSANTTLETEAEWLLGVSSGKASEVTDERKQKIETMKTAAGLFAQATGQLMPQAMPILQAVGMVAEIPMSRVKQDVAIAWIASLGPADLEAIDDVDGELKALGVIDAEGNRLGYDTEDYTSDADQRMVWLRAQVEQEVMAVVGTTLQWRGGGKVSGNRVWRATGVSDSYPVGWGVVCTGYTKPQGGLPDQNGAKDTNYKNMYRSQYVLHVSPTGDEGAIDPSRPSAEQG